MLEIKENQELNVTNLLSYRGKLKQTELENIGKEMESYIQSAGAKRVGNPITATYELEGDEIICTNSAGRSQTVMMQLRWKRAR